MIDENLKTAFVHTRQNLVNDFRMNIVTPMNPFSGGMPTCLNGGLCSGGHV